MAKRLYAKNIATLHKTKIANTRNPQDQKKHQQQSYISSRQVTSTHVTSTLDSNSQSDSPSDPDEYYQNIPSPESSVKSVSPVISKRSPEKQQTSTLKHSKSFTPRSPPAQKKTTPQSSKTKGKLTSTQPTLTQMPGGNHFTRSKTFPKSSTSKAALPGSLLPSNTDNNKLKQQGNTTIKNIFRKQEKKNMLPINTTEKSHGFVETGIERGPLPVILDQMKGKRKRDEETVEENVADKKQRNHLKIAGTDEYVSEDYYKQIQQMFKDAIITGFAKNTDGKLTATVKKVYAVKAPPPPPKPYIGTYSRYENNSRE